MTCVLLASTIGQLVDPYSISELEIKQTKSLALRLLLVL
jgi:hypothetical protein